MKLACVVHRYGADIAGGSEAHCRQLAERLAAAHDVTVLTTCARDYVTWANHHAAGASTVGGVKVIRFAVERPRDPARFAVLSAAVFAGRTTAEREAEWFLENGPVAPALLDHLRQHGQAYDAVLFWAYRYYPAYFGLPLVADRAILVPTAEDDPAVDLDLTGAFFARPAGFLFLTPEERDLVSRRSVGPLAPSAVIGSGIDAAAAAPDRACLDRLGIPPAFVLYLGRVDPNKGCDALFRDFTAYARDGGEATLVLAGPHAMRVPEHPRIRALGFVSDDVRDALLAHARLLVVPSPYESLSIVLLEAWNRAVPAIVNGQCRPLAGQVERAAGGLSYRQGREFAAALTRMWVDRPLAAALGRQGLAYVEREYRWPAVLARVEGVLRGVARDRIS